MSKSLPQDCELHLSTLHARRRVSEKLLISPADSRIPMQLFSELSGRGSRGGKRFLEQSLEIISKAAFVSPSLRPECDGGSPTLVSQQAPSRRHAHAPVAVSLSLSPSTFIRPARRTVILVCRCKVFSAHLPAIENPKMRLCLCGTVIHNQGCPTLPAEPRHKSRHAHSGRGFQIQGSSGQNTRVARSPNRANLVQQTV